MLPARFASSRGAAAETATTGGLRTGLIDAEASPEVELAVEERGDDVAVHMRDSCGGISPAELRVIFQPFIRARSDQSGAGLGLSIASQAIQAKGGKIHAQSSASGCDFWFTLPRHPV
jgi:signal transduction histidine kinase